MTKLIALDGVEARYSEYQPGARPQYFRIDALGALHYADADDYMLCLTTIGARVPCALLRGLTYLSIDERQVHCPSEHTVTRYEIHRYETHIDLRTAEGVECRFTLKVLDSHTSASNTRDAAGPAQAHISRYTALHPPATFRELLPGDALTLGTDPGPGGLLLGGPTIATRHLDFMKDTRGIVSVSPVESDCEFAVNCIARRGRIVLLPQDRVTVGRNTIMIDHEGNLLHDLPDSVPDGLVGSTTNAFPVGFTVQQVGMVARRTGQLAAYLPDAHIAPGNTLAVLAPEGVESTGASDAAGAHLPLATLLAGPGQSPDYEHVEGTISVGEYQVYGAQATTKHRLLHEQIAYLSAHSGLEEDLTVTQTIRVAQALLTPHVFDDDALRLEVETLRHVGILPLRSTRVSRLNRLDRRLLAIALELLTRPRVLILEQPFAGLDADQAANLAAVLKSYAQHFAASVAYSTDSVTVARLADQVVAFQSPQETIPHFAVAYVGSSAGLTNPQLGNTPAAIMRTLRRGGSEVPVPVHAQHVQAPAVRRRLTGRRHSFAQLVAREAALSLHAPTPAPWLRRDLERGLPGVPAVAWGIGRTLAWLVLAPVLLCIVALWLGHEATLTVNGPVQAGLPALSLVCVGIFVLALREARARCRPLSLARDVRWGVAPRTVVFSRAVVAWVRALVPALICVAIIVTATNPLGAAPSEVPYLLLILAVLTAISLVGVGIGMFTSVVSADARVGRWLAGAVVALVALAPLVGTNLWQLELRPLGISLASLAAIALACGALSTFDVARTSQTTSNRKVHHGS